MVKGLYTAYTGMINEQHRMDVLTNNLANANTNGYKKEGATAQSFRDHLALKIKDYTDAPNTARGLGIINPGVKIGEGYVDWSEGPMKETGNTFDFAISGDGFFAYNDADGRPLYTRNGNFTWALAETGGTDLVLTTAEGNKVLDINGAEIRVTGNAVASRITIGGDGKIHFLKADVPLRKIFGYATGVRSISKGTALYSMKLLGYKPATV